MAERLEVALTEQETRESRVREPRRDATGMRDLWPCSSVLQLGEKGDQEMLGCKVSYVGGMHLRL